MVGGGGGGAYVLKNSGKLQYFPSKNSYYAIHFHAASPLNVFTVQNPRRRVVLKKTSQLRTICTHIRRNPVCLFISFRQLFSWGLKISVDMVSTYDVRLYKFVT
jgi:hypothetical protein